LGTFKKSVFFLAVMGWLGAAGGGLRGAQDLARSSRSPPRKTTPPVGTGLLDGDIAFRQHDEGHADGPNRPFFLDFAERHFKALP